ncbi:MAG: L-seryl-tRNA(Sec) selenium transferase [Halanaerobiales bacterium]
MKEKLLSQIPSVNDLLELEKTRKLIDKFSRPLVIEGIRQVTDKIRNKILEENDEENLSDYNINDDLILNDLTEFLEIWSRPNLSPAINATGVVVHTNLGRSLLSESAVESLNEVARNYSTLEIERESGERGSRYNNVTELLKDLTGAESAMIVNNNAGAVMLALNSLAENKEVIIPRGELVEIGGSFRIPDVMKRSGAELVEIGATNKVYLEDYINAVTENTGLLLKVHTSNYKIVGFTKGVELKKLVGYAHNNGLPVMDDLGSGILIDLRKDGFNYEPTVQERISAGADIVTFSGDKLLGGPQAGIIVGKKEYISKMKKNPMTRALRVDKFTLAALEATLKEYKDINKAKKNIPTIRMLTENIDNIKKRADKLYKDIEKNELQEKFEVRIAEDIAKVGGGAFPLEKLETYTLCLKHNDMSPSNLSYKLRMNYPPIFSRIKNNEILLDFRTIKNEDLAKILDALKEIG